MPQISNHWHQTVLLLFLPVKTEHFNSWHLPLWYHHVNCKQLWPHVLVQTQKVIYKVHHFCFAELWGDVVLSVHREHDQRAAVLIESTCRDRNHVNSRIKYNLRTRGSFSTFESSICTAIYINKVLFFYYIWELVVAVSLQTRPNKLSSALYVNIQTTHSTLVNMDMRNKFKTSGFCLQRERVQSEFLHGSNESAAAPTGRLDSFSTLSKRDAMMWAACTEKLCSTCHNADYHQEHLYFRPCGQSVSAISKALF